MNRNIEIKARAAGFASQMGAAARIADGAPEVIRQEDTFFNVPRGRLKLRIVSDRHGELIYYERPDLSGPKECRYLITKTREPGQLGRILGEVLGVLGVVSKQRTVYLVGQTRIHFDEVEGLGRFIELEVVLNPEQEPSEGEKLARRLMEELSVSEDDLVEGAYLDLRLEQADPKHPSTALPSTSFILSNSEGLRAGGCVLRIVEGPSCDPQGSEPLRCIGQRPRTQPYDDSRFDLRYRTATDNPRCSPCRRVTALDR